MTKQGNSKHLFLRETSSGQTRKTSSGQTKKGLEDCSVILSENKRKISDSQQYSLKLGLIKNE